MENIQVTSAIDLQTYFKIALKNYLKPKFIAVILFMSIIVSYSLFSNPSAAWWEELLIVWLMLFVFGVYLPLKIYLTCKKNIKKIAYLNETQTYTINNDVIENRGATTTSSSNWQYVTKLVENKKYFLLMTANTSFHYLPKNGFGSTEDILRFKNIVIAKEIKTN